MALKLHRCGLTWVKLDAHSCWRVQKALDEMGVEYAVVKEPLSRGKRKAVIEKTGQKHLPAIELEDGTWYREESAAMAEAIRARRFSGGSPA